MSELPHSHAGSTNTQRNTCGGEDGTSPGEPARQIGGEVGVLPGGKLVGPEILASSVGHGAGKLRQTDTDAGRHEGHPGDTVDGQDGASRVDTGDQGRGDTEPGVCQRETDPKQRQHGEVALHVLGVPHLGQLQRIFVQRAKLSVVSRGRLGHGFLLRLWASHLVRGSYRAKRGNGLGLVGKTGQIKSNVRIGRWIDTQGVDVGRKFWGTRRFSGAYGHSVSTDGFLSIAGRAFRGLPVAAMGSYDGSRVSGIRAGK